MGEWGARMNAGFPTPSSRWADSSREQGSPLRGVGGGRVPASRGRLNNGVGLGMRMKEGKGGSRTAPTRRRGWLICRWFVCEVMTVTTGPNGGGMTEGDGFPPPSSRGGLFAGTTEGGAGKNGNGRGVRPMKGGGTPAPTRGGKGAQRRRATTRVAPTEEGWGAERRRGSVRERFGNRRGMDSRPRLHGGQAIRGENGGGGKVQG